MDERNQGSPDRDIKIKTTSRTRRTGLMRHSICTKPKTHYCITNFSKAILTKIEMKWIINPNCFKNSRNDFSLISDPLYRSGYPIQNHESRPKTVCWSISDRNLAINQSVRDFVGQFNIESYKLFGFENFHNESFTSISWS